MTGTEFDAWMEEVSRAVVRLVDVLDAKPGEELSDTQIIDKDGVVHDLAELVKSPCVITTGVSCIMSINDYCMFDGPRWVTYGGHFYKHCEELTKAIREHADDPGVEITVHRF